MPQHALGAHRAAHKPTNDKPDLAFMLGWSSTKHLYPDVQWLTKSGLQGAEEVPQHALGAYRAAHKHTDDGPDLAFLLD